MARPPEIGEYTPQVPVEEGLRRVIPEARGIGAGQDIAELGGAVQKVAVSEAANYTMNALSQAQGQWTEQLRKAQETAPPGAPGFTPAFMDQYSKYVDQTMKSAPNDLARRMLNQHLTEFGNHLQQQAIGFETQARVDHSVDSFKTSVDTTDNELLANPQLYDQRLAERTRMLNLLNIDPQTKEKLAIYGKQQMSRFAAEGDIQRDPMAALAQLYSPTPKGFYADVTPTDRTELEGKALALQRELNAAGEHQLLLNDRLQKHASDVLAKQGDDLIAKHQMTPSWLTDHQDILEPSEYRYFSRRLSGAEEVTDPATYADLLTRSQAGEDVSEPNRYALTHGLEKLEDYTRVQDNVSKERPGWFKRAATNIHDALEPSPGDVVHNPELRQTLVLAQEDWQEWASQHPDPSPSEVRSQQDHIINSYSMIASDKLTQGLKAPKFLLGTRQEPVDEQGNPDPMMNSVATRTTQALLEGRITPQEAADESKLIAQYRKINALNAARAAAAKAKDKNLH